MTATIKIKCDNAAFVESVGAELARILRELAAKLDGLSIEDVQTKHGDHYNSTITLRDINGNRVGALEFN